MIESDIPGHSYRCWFPVGTPENEAAYEHNLSAGHTATGAPVIQPDTAGTRAGAH